MQKLIDQIKLARSGDNNAMMEIIEKFSPLIGKYTSKLDYDEDCRSELVLKLITLVKIEINFDKLRNDNDGTVIEYIRESIVNKYISLIKSNRHIRDNETAYDQETFVDLLEDKLQYSEEMDSGLLIDSLNATLTEREFMCIKLIVFDGWTAEAVAKRLGVSRQAVNQCKKRALEKIKTQIS